MVNIISLIAFTSLISSCSVDKSGQAFTFPSDEISPAPPTGGTPSDGISPTPPTGGTSDGAGIAISAMVAVNGNASDVRGNLIYDGVRLLIPIAPNFSLAGDSVTFQYFSLSLSSIGSSSSVYTGINSTGYGHFTFASRTNFIGQSVLFWGTTSDYTSDKMSIRDNSNGTVTSTVDITFSNYGCSTHPQYKDPITFCNGNYYGVCVSNSRFMRLFSFDSSGSLQSAVTTTAPMPSDYDKMTALTCYNDSYLLMAKNATIYKYDLSFQLSASATVPFSDSIKGITTDGVYLYLQGDFDSSHGLPYFFNIYKTSFGNLK